MKKIYKLEKSILKNEWLVFKKIGISAWAQVYKNKNKSEAKKWIFSKCKIRK